MSTITKEAAKPTNGIAKKVNLENKVYKTSDYTIFKRVSGNRLLNISHVNKLKESMKEHDLMIPIIVNEKNEVIDGQHRIQARTELKFPVYYIIINGLGIHDTQKANANNKNWRTVDFLNYYVEQNFYHYKIINEFIKRYRFGIGESIVLLSSSRRDYLSFNNGEFYVIDLERANSTAEKIYQLEPYYKGFKRRSFVFSIIHALNIPDFDFDEFINKVSYQSSKLVHCTGVEQYLRIIEDIYNYKRKTEDKIRFI